MIALFVFGGPRMLARVRGINAPASMLTDDVTPRGHVVVLPFTGDSAFAQPLSDELAHALASVPGVRVTSRASANTFEGRPPNALTLGKTLDVGSRPSTGRRASCCSRKTR
jgi:TolB-like protein